MNRKHRAVKLSGTGFGIYRRQERIEKIRTRLNESLNAIAGIYEDDFENTAGHLDNLLEKLETDSLETVSLLFKTMGRLLTEHTEREEAKRFRQDPKTL